MNRIKEMLFVFVLLILSTTVFAGLYYLIAKLFFLLKIDFFPYFSRVVKIWIIFFLCFIFANKRFGDVIDWKRIKYIEKNNEDRRPFLFFILFVVFSAFLGFILTLISVYEKVSSGLSINRSGWFFLGFFMMTLGAIFFCFGILMDLTIRTNLNTSPVENRYYIRNIIEK